MRGSRNELHPIVIALALLLMAAVVWLFAKVSVLEDHDRMAWDHLDFLTAGHYRREGVVYVRNRRELAAAVDSVSAAGGGKIALRGGDYSR